MQESCDAGLLHMKIEELEERIGVEFRDKNLLRQALTHRSYLNEAETHQPLEDNERLEYLGDALLDFIVAEMLCKRFPEFREGPLTDVRAALVRSASLAELARRIELGSYLYMGHGEAASGGRQREATLCAAFEALMGAIYMDQGLEVARAFVLPLLEDMLPQAVEIALRKDPKSRLQELAQARGMGTPRYREIAQEGPDHRRTFTIGAYIGDVEYGRGKGSSKQAAGQAAAEEALRRLEAEDEDKGRSVDLRDGS